MKLVAIYAYPLTEERLEGKATLLKRLTHLGVYDGRSYDRWIVRFEGDSASVERNVLEPKQEQNPQ